MIRYALLMVSLGLVSCRSVSEPAPARPLARYQYERPEMGVPFRITLYAADPAQAR